MRALIALAMLLLVLPAQAQQVCGPRDEIVARLFLFHDEIKNVQGLLEGGLQIVEIFSKQSPGKRGRSFTIIITHPDCTSCLHMVGHRWRYVSDKGV